MSKLLKPEGYAPLLDLQQTELAIKKIKDFDLLAPSQSNWVNANTLCRYLNKVREEAIEPDSLLSAAEPEVCALGEAYALYQQMLADENAIDFSAIQSEMLLDEYQDTNTIQERILLKLAGAKANICVVGDEDQSIYRFRGASVRNILQFAENFPAGRCKTVVLDTNYRSHPDIVRFYNSWMDRCDWKDGAKRFRYDKTISPQPDKTFDDCPGVIRLTGEDVDDWCEEVQHFIEKKVNEKAIIVENIHLVAEFIVDFAELF